MARSCPRCDPQPLRPLRVSGVDVDTSPHCHGLWFRRGTLERFAERAPVRRFPAAARGAPSRCRKGGHPMPREQTACARCRSAPVACPDCRTPLGRVVTAACGLDVCPQCEGIWLDAGGFEALAGGRVPQARPAGAGGAHALSTCSACGVGLQARESFAYQGDVYCARCRPPSAVPRPG